MTHVQFLLVGNGGQYNRGCQAIELGTMKILSQATPGAAFVSAPFSRKWAGDTAAPGETRLYPDRAWDDFTGAALLARKAASAIAPTQRWRVYRHRTTYLEQVISESKVMLEVGGDNYSLDYGRPDGFVALDRVALSKDVPVVIWGASVGPFDRHPRYERFLAEHLRALTGVFAREDRTAEYLESIGVNNVYRVADPAFLMEPESVDHTSLGFQLEKGAVGLNLSPLIGRLQGLDRKGWLSRAADLIAAVKNNMKDRRLVLVPHVLHPPANDDHAFLVEAAQLAGVEVDIVPPTLTAPQLKGVIACLECFVGARTHATIAAFSTMTPCGSIAYSIKAEGINQDVYGSTEWVLPLAELTPARLTALFLNLLEAGPQLRNDLSLRMPIIRADAARAGHLIMELIR